MAASDDVLRRLQDLTEGTYAERAGIRLHDTPASLYRLLLLADLLSARISSNIAVSATRELIAAGFGTVSGMLDSSWQARVDALGRGHYQRYDESTATRLADGAQLLQDRYHGDLRRLAGDAGKDVDQAANLLQDLPGIGPLGASVFLREVQAVWTWVRPYIDDRVADGARALGLPHTARGLATAAGTEDLARLAAGLVDVARNGELRDRVRG